MSDDLKEYYAKLEDELTKAQKATAEAHDEYLEKTFDKVVPVATKIHHEQMRNSKRKPARFNAEKEFERTLKIMLDIPDGYDVWLKKDDDLAVDEYRRKIQNIICQGALVGTVYLFGRAAGSAKSDSTREKISMFLINHFLGNPPQRIAVADVSSDVKDHFAELRQALLASGDNGDKDAEGEGG